MRATPDDLDDLIFLRHHRRRVRAEWLVKGVVVMAILLAIFGALYVAFGPQKWMALGGFLWASTVRGWWRARP